MAKTFTRRESFQCIKSVKWLPMFTPLYLAWMKPVKAEVDAGDNYTKEEMISFANKMKKKVEGNAKARNINIGAKGFPVTDDYRDLLAQWMFYYSWSGMDNAAGRATQNTPEHRAHMDARRLALHGCDPTGPVVGYTEEIGELLEPIRLRVVEAGAMTLNQAHAFSAEIIEAGTGLILAEVRKLFARWVGYQYWESMLKSGMFKGRFSDSEPTLKLSSQYFPIEGGPAQRHPDKPEFVKAAKARPSPRLRRAVPKRAPSEPRSVPVFVEFFFHIDTTYLKVAEELLPTYSDNVLVDVLPHSFGRVIMSPEQYNDSFGSFLTKFLGHPEVKGTVEPRDDLKRLAKMLYTWHFRGFIPPGLLISQVRLIPRTYRVESYGNAFTRNKEQLAGQANDEVEYIDTQFEDWQELPDDNFGNQ